MCLDRQQMVDLAHKGYAEVYGKHTGGAQQYGYRHDRSRRLHHARYGGADEKEYDDGEITACVERLEEFYKFGIVVEPELIARLTEQDKAEEHESYTEEEVSYIAVAPRIDKNQTHDERREDKVYEVDGEAEAHDPCREGGAYVGSHDDRDGLCEREQPRVDKRDGHYGGCRRRLDGAGDERSCEHTGEAVGGHGAENVAQLRSCHLL